MSDSSWSFCILVAIAFGVVQLVQSWISTSYYGNDQSYANLDESKESFS
jgi:hypothetical protein